MQCYGYLFLICMTTCLGLSQFSQNVAIKAKGGDCWKYDQLIKDIMYNGCHLWLHILFFR